jgi:hypothetical protein
MSTISASTTTTTAYVVTADTTGTLVLKTGATPTTAVTIDTSQKVGIGTTSPNDVLEVAGNDAFIRINRTANEPGIDMRVSGSNTNKGVIAVTTGGSMYFTSGGNTERMRIDSSGNVGIGSSTITSADGAAGRIFKVSGATNTVWVGETTGNGGYNAFIFEARNSNRTNPRFAQIQMQTTSTATDGGLITFSTSATGTGTDITERMRIDTSGSVAIGSTSTASATRLTVLGAGTGTNTLASFKDSGGNTLFQVREDGIVNLPFAVSGDAHLKIQQGAVTTLGAVASSGVSIGGGGANNQLCQIGLGYASTYQPTAISSITTTQSGYTIADLIFATRSVNTDTAPSTRMTIAGSGSIGAPSGTNIYNASDARLKKNIQPLTKGLDAVNALKPVSFNWITDFCPVENDKTMYGFVAQDTKEVDENLVEGFNDGSDVVVGDLTVEKAMRVNEKFIIPMLTKAIQELKAELDTVKAELAALRG